MSQTRRTFIQNLLPGDLFFFDGHSHDTCEVVSRVNQANLTRIVYTTGGIESEYTRVCLTTVNKIEG